MANLDLLSKEWCEQIFHGRNKEYGAYVLRKYAGRRYARALIIVVLSLSLIVGCFLLLNIYNANSLESIVADMSGFSELSALGPERVAVMSPVKKQMEVKTRKEPIDSKVNIVETPKEEYSLALEIEKTEGGKKEELGQPESVDTIVSKGAIKEDLNAYKVIYPTDVVEQMPEFPGGTAAFMKWMDKNIVYPESCLAAKQEMQLNVSFYVDPAGNVFNPEIAEECPMEFKQSVMRAFEKMPKWNPGKWKGEPVTVYITLPIYFQI